MQRDDLLGKLVAYLKWKLKPFDKTTLKKSGAKKTEPNTHRAKQGRTHGISAEMFTLQEQVHSLEREEEMKTGLNSTHQTKREDWLTAQDSKQPSDHAATTSVCLKAWITFPSHSLGPHPQETIQGSVADFKWKFERVVPSAVAPRDFLSYRKLQQDSHVWTALISCTI